MFDVFPVQSVVITYVITVIICLNVLAIIHSDDKRLPATQQERRKAIQARRTFKIIFWPVWLPIQLVIWAVMLLIFLIKEIYKGIVAMKLFKKLG